MAVAARTPRTRLQPRASPRRTHVRGRCTPPSSPAPGGSAPTPGSSRLVDPSSPEESADEAAAAICRFVTNNGKTKSMLQVELYVPPIFRSDLDDWPGGIRQQFQVAAPMVERMLLEVRRVANGELDGRLTPEVIDNADAVGLWSSPKLLCVLHPTAETLNTIVERSQEPSCQVVILVNPQWTTRESQVISDFGIGPWRQRAEDFLSQFTTAFSQVERRVSGVTARVVRSYPERYVLIHEDAEIASFEDEPTLAEIKSALAESGVGDEAGGLFERLKGQFMFNANSLK